MNYVHFTNNSIQVKNAIKDKCLKFLVEASSLLVNQVVRNTTVKTGQLKRSWDFKINENELEAQVGSPLENAIWEEFGTGEYALNGDGRKGSWSYKDSVTGEWHKTKGKKPKRALYQSFISKFWKLCR